MLLLLSVLTTLLPAVEHAAASEQTDSGAAEAPVRATNRAVPRVGGPGERTSTHFWIWSRGSLGYFLRNPMESNFGYEEIVAVDLERGDEVAVGQLTPPAYKKAGKDQETAAWGSDRSMVVDEAGGRLIVATEGGRVTPSVAPTLDLFVPTTVCPRLKQQNSQWGSCFSGISVLDARSLETQRHIKYQQVRAENPNAVPLLLAMTFTPATDASGAKVHALVEESVHSNELSTKTTSTRPHSLHVISLVQFDVDAGTQEWSVQLVPCRGGLMTNNSTSTPLEGFRHQAAIFRGQHPGDDAIYVACHLVSQTLQGGVVRVPLDDAGMPPSTPVPVPSAETPDEFDPGSPESSRPDHALKVPDRITWTAGPDRVHEMMADPGSGRVVMQVLDGKPLAEVWWVFDTATMRFVGTIGVGGPTTLGGTMSALEEGHLFLLSRPYSVSGRSFAGGFFIADIRTTPIGQALVYPELAHAFPGPEGAHTNSDRWALTTQRVSGELFRFWHPKDFRRSHLTTYGAVEVRFSPAELLEVDDFAGRTLDLAEMPGVTDATWDGAARGYGVRALLVGGAEAAARVGPADPLGLVDQCNDESGDPYAVGTVSSASTGQRSEQMACAYLGTSVGSPCTQGDREVVLAAIGPENPAVVDGTGARGSANPVTIDSLTAADGDSPLSRCAGQDWDQLWAGALFGRAPVGEPRGPENLDASLAECVSGSDAPSARTGDPVADGMSAEVACEKEETSGYAYARGFGFDQLDVAEALSSFRIYRDPGRGIVARVESVARGIRLGGVASIDTVRGVAESWANGRSQPVPPDSREADYDPNCDMERSAGTCFTRHLFGVWTPGYSCGPCGDELALVDAVNGVITPLGMQAQLREPDPRLRRGSANGFIAAIQKSEPDRFGDMVLNNDLLQTVLPTFEVVRQAPPNRPLSRLGARGRQIYQFAGVEVSSSYGIECLLVYDEAANTCAGEKQLPGAIQVSLADPDGKALAGGAFEVRQDVDADGVLGLKDTLLPDGACVTTDDGVGTCTFEGLQLGTYLVNQVVAPPGYAKSAEPFVVELASGEQRTVAFTNVSNLSTVELKATDEHGAPVSGAVFAAYPDPDSDGKVAPDAKPSAECTTDAQGACSMRVPAGSYVLVQTSAPAGLEGIEPVAFTFASGGQAAAVTVVNYPPEAPAAPEAPASPSIDYTPPVDAMPPTEIVGDYLAPDMAEAPETAQPPVIAQIGDTITQVIRAPGDALRLLARDPKEAVAWTAALALFCLAVMAIRRRGLLAQLAQANR